MRKGSKKGKGGQSDDASLHLRWRMAALGFVVRLFLVWIGVDEWVSNRPELIPASHSFKDIQEGLFLKSRGLSPYAGDSFHHPPLLLEFYAVVMSLPGAKSYAKYYLGFLSALIDICIAWTLQAIARNVTIENDTSNYSKEDYEQSQDYVTEHLMEKEHRPSKKIPGFLMDETLPKSVFCAYLFNPISVLTSASPSTKPLSTLFVAATLLFAQEQRLVATSFCLALSTYLSLHPAALLPSCAALLAPRPPPGSGGGGGGGRGGLRPPQPLAHLARRGAPPAAALAALAAAAAAWLAVLLGASWASSGGSWAFLRAAHGWALGAGGGGGGGWEAGGGQPWHRAPDSGLYWYFFAEVFPRFSQYFLLVLGAHPFLYVAPLALRLGMYPLKTATVLVGVAAVFQPAPCLHDLAFAAVLALLFPRTLARVRNAAAFGALALVPLALMPVMHHLWLGAGGGNANFFYFQTVLHNFCACMFVLQFVAASMRHRKALQVALKKQNKEQSKSGEVKRPGSVLHQQQQEQKPQQTLSSRQ